MREFKIGNGVFDMKGMLGFRGCRFHMKIGKSMRPWIGSVLKIEYNTVAIFTDNFDVTIVRVPLKHVFSRTSTTQNQKRGSCRTKWYSSMNDF